MKKVVLTLVLSMFIACTTNKVETPIVNQVTPTVTPTMKVVLDTPKVVPTKLSNVTIDNSRAVLIKGPVEDYNMQDAINKFKQFAQESSKPVYLILNTPGGSVTDGYELINTLESIRKQFKVKTICFIETEAYSMGALIVTYCDQAYMHKHASLMFHAASFSVQGEAHHIKSRVDFFTKYLHNLNVEVAEKLHMTPEEYETKIINEYWLTAQEALDAKIITGVVSSIYYTVQPAQKPNSGNFMFGGKNNNIVTNPLKVPNSEPTQK